MEAGAFKALLKCLVPGYVTPTRKTVSSRIRLLYEHKKEEIRESLVSVQHVSYTTDCWTSIGTRDYMTVTAHTIDEDWCRANQWWELERRQTNRSATPRKRSKTS